MLSKSPSSIVRVVVGTACVAYFVVLVKSGTDEICWDGTRPRGLILGLMLLSYILGAWLVLGIEKDDKKKSKYLLGAMVILPIILMLTDIR